MKVVIRHVAFRYRVEKARPGRPEETILTQKVAYQGESVDIPRDEDYERGLALEAFVTPETPPARAAGPVSSKSSEEEETMEESSVSDMSDTELIEWIQRDKPNVQTVIDAAEGDPENARRLLAAEDKATGGDSRQGVIKGLSAIVGVA